MRRRKKRRKGERMRGVREFKNGGKKMKMKMEFVSKGRRKKRERERD